MNLATIIVAAVVLFAVVAAWRYTRKQKSSCGSHCPGCSAACHLSDKEKSI